MSDSILVTLIVTILSSTALFTFIQFLISRHDRKKGVLAEMRKNIQELMEFNREERCDLLRIQLMTLIHIHPENIVEIMEIAEEYFLKHHGNWYMSSIFRKYMEENNLDVPLWMKELK